METFRPRGWELEAWGSVLWARAGISAEPGIEKEVVKEDLAILGIGDSQSCGARLPDELSGTLAVTDERRCAGSEFVSEGQVEILHQVPVRLGQRQAAARVALGRLPMPEDRVDTGDEPLPPLMVQRRPGEEPVLVGGMRRVNHPFIIGRASIGLLEQPPDLPIDLLGKRLVVVPIHSVLLWKRGNPPALPHPQVEEGCQVATAGILRHVLEGRPVGDSVAKCLVVPMQELGERGVAQLAPQAVEE